MERFTRIFRKLPDPRAENARHDLTEILVIALAAALCGAEGCADMADFGEAKEGLLRQLLRLEPGIPSHDTFSWVFRILDPLAFETAFRKLMAAFANIKGVVSIDGKALKGAFERGRKTTLLHLVDVWAADARLAIAQQLALNRNEVAGTLEVLKLLSLKGGSYSTQSAHSGHRLWHTHAVPVVLAPLDQI